ncbi:MAG: hypothetical protein ACT4O2_04990 [Beijerinckiaceae bacterium]
MATLIEATIPDQLARQAQALVTQGWASDFNALLVEALRRYCESHPSQLAESFIQEDVRWGLHGDD